MAANGKHKRLAGSFSSPSPERGSKLQELLTTPGRTAAPTAASPPEPGPTETDAAQRAVGVALQPVPIQTDMTEPATKAAAVEHTATLAHRKRTGEGRGASASSVYLTTATYKQLKTTKSQKIKDYAQITQDAFAQIAQEAAEEQKTPDEVLSALFEVPEDTDSWLMPSSDTSRSKSATPLTEARISFSAPAAGVDRREDGDCATNGYLLGVSLREFSIIISCRRNGRPVVAPSIIDFDWRPLA